MHTPGYTRLEATAVAAGARDVLTDGAADPDSLPVRSGRVIQAFDRTAYLAFDGDRSTPDVLMLGTPTIRDGPLLVRTDADRSFTFSGTVGRGDGCRLRPATDTGYILSIGDVLEVALTPDLLGPPAGPVDRTGDIGTIRRGGPTWQRGRTVLQHVTDAGLTDGIGWTDALQDAADGRDADGLLDAVTETWTGILAGRRDEDDIDALLPIVGRGPGATPSGDDILSGLLVTLVRTTSGPARRSVRTAAHHLLRRGADTTTTMSIALLEQAAMGRSPAAVDDCLTALLDAAPPERCRATATAMADIGHHSGPDALAGMLTALLLIAPRLSPSPGGPGEELRGVDRPGR